MLVKAYTTKGGGFSNGTRTIKASYRIQERPKSNIGQYNATNNGTNETIHAEDTMKDKKIINFDTVVNKSNSVNKTKKVPKKLFIANDLPTVANINPRSIYGKENTLKTFIDEHAIDCTFLSESWERINFPLENLMGMEGYQVISNPYQRTGRGGRPALIIKKEKYFIKNLTNTVVDIP